MRHLLLLIAAVTLTACGGGDKLTAPEKGTVYFRIDAATCTGTGTIAFVIDGAIVGTQTLSAGQQSNGFDADAGQHVLGARESVQPGFVWPSQNVTIPANTSYTLVLTC